MNSSDPKADIKTPLRSIEDVLPDISKLLPRLASDFDPEIIATVSAIKRKLASAGLDLNDLGSLVLAIPKALAAMTSTQLPPPKPPEPVKPSDFEWDDIGPTRTTTNRRQAPPQWTPSTPPPPPPPRRRLSTIHRDLAEEALRLGLMKPKEKTFLNDILNRDYELTAAQEKWLNEIHFRVKEFTNKLF